MEPNSSSVILAFVLLSQPQIDLQQFTADLKTDWGIELPSTAAGDNSSMVADYDGMRLFVGMMPVHIPEETEYYAKMNYLWKDAEEVARAHKAHIVLSVSGDDVPATTRARFFTKAASTMLKQPSASAIYINQTVYEPKFYIEAAAELHKDPEAYPILDWVWIGLLNDHGKTRAYTSGLKNFGKREMEVCANAPAGTLMELLGDIAYYVISSDVTINPGETVGNTPDMRLKVSLRKGVAVEGESLKIEYEQPKKKGLLARLLGL